MYKLRTSIVKHENPEVATLCMLFFLLLLYYLCKDSKVLNYHPLSGNNKWGLLVILFAVWETCFRTVGKQNSISGDSLASITTCFKYGRVSLESKIYSLIFWKCRRNSFHTRASISARKRWSTSESPCFVSPHLFPLLSHYLWGEGMNNFSIFPFKICETNLAPPPEAYGKVEIFSENQYPLEPQFTRP